MKLLELIDILHALVILAILGCIVVYRFVVAIVAMLANVLGPITVRVLGAEWDPIVRLIVGVVAMVLVILMEHANVIQDLCSIQHPRNANFLASIYQVHNVMVHK